VKVIVEGKMVEREMDASPRPYVAHSVGEGEDERDSVGGCRA
jgi:hypothetical protein